MSAERPSRVTIVVPVFDDWDSVRELARRLDDAFADRGPHARLVVVDDGSIQRPRAGDLSGPYRSFAEVEVLHLARNLGHQRAIAIGLTFVQQERPCDAVVVMDGDGEDRPEDVRVLLDELARHSGEKVVFAARARRSEGPLFRVFYHAYRLLHLLLTGVPVRVGNFSALPFERLATFVVVSEAWNHYAASVFKARIPWTMVPIARGERISGRSTMNFVALVTHGLSAISVFGDIVGVRLLVASMAGLGTFAAIYAAGLGLARAGTVELPAGFETWGLVAILLCVQLLILAFVITFSILSSRNNLSFLPVRDYRFFVSRVDKRFPAAG
jgi:glycosyltransferase involved in cell wall biosynthesis